MNLEPRRSNVERGTSLILGTRSSPLALWQAEHVAARLRGAFAGLQVSLERIKTSGDKIQDVPLAQVGGKALFVKEIEEALLAGRVDLAVHSMKDVPTDLPAGLAILAVTERESPSDVLISRQGARLADLPGGAIVGTSSLRRQAQLLHHRPDLRVVGLRGNLDTRIRKLRSEGLDAIVVAAAGVKRLGLSHLVSEVLPAEILLPAIGQGALGIEGRVAAGVDRERGIADIVRTLDHPETHTAVRAERAMLARLAGGCQVPIAALATLEADGIRLRGLVASPDGAKVIRGERRAPREHPDSLGAGLAEELLSRGAAGILASVCAAGGTGGQG